MTSPDGPSGARRRLGRGRTRRLLVPMAVVAMASLVLLAGSGLSQINDPEDPRNRTCGEDAGGCNASKDCWMHHRGEGMRDAFILVPIVPQQLRHGEEAEAMVQVINPWKNHIGGISVNVNIISEEGTDPLLFVPGAAAGGGVDPPGPVTYEGRFAQQPGGGTPPLQLNFSVELNPVAIDVKAKLVFHDPVPGTTPDPDGVHLRVMSENLRFGYPLNPADPRSTERNVTVTGDDLLQIRAGTAWVEMFWDKEVWPGTTVDYEVTVQVVYGAAEGEVVTYSIQTFDSDLLLIDPGTSELITFSLNSLGRGTQRLEIEVRAFTWYRDRHLDGVTADYDNYTRYASMDVRVGDEFIPSANSPADVAPPGTDVRLLLGEVTGIAAALLLFPSLLLGGTFGKGSRKFLNKVLGGAKRRVMYHSLASLGISVAAVVHIVMFLLEIRYSLLMGVLWGGLGTLALLVLGLTGYYQVPLIQRHGYKWWRYTHLVFGVLVIVFVTWHAIVDGPHFNFLKQQLPEALTRWNLTDK